jgi:hypothetical protein
MNSVSQFFDKNIYGKSKNLSPFRQDIAASYLSKYVTSKRFVDGVKMQVLQGVTALRRNPDPYSEQVSQILFGSHFIVYEEKNSWAWGQSLDDHYVGYLPFSALDQGIDKPTHRVSCLATNLYEEPSGKSRSIQGMPFNSVLKLEKLSRDGRFIQTPVGWVPLEHISPLEEQLNYVEVAEMFLTCPYLWGGKTLLGIDCSGLVQVALNAFGIMCPRDTGMQFVALKAKHYDDRTSLGRGDIMFFPGHVGIMSDEENLIHANAHHMATVNEPLGHVIDRLREDHEDPVTGYVPASLIAELNQAV